jgi:hypothetical protein
MAARKNHIAKLIRLTPDDAALLDRLVDKTGLSQSVLYRRLLRATAAGDPFDRKAAEAIERHLQRIGVNLNQVARRYNSGQVVRDEELAKALEQVADGLARTVGEFRALKLAAQSTWRNRLEDETP